MTGTTTIIVDLYPKFTELQEFEIGLRKILRREENERKKNRLRRLSLHA